MTIQEALEIVADLAAAKIRDGVKGAERKRKALAIVEIMLTEEAFFSAYQEVSVEDELKLQAEEARR